MTDEDEDNVATLPARDRGRHHDWKNGKSRRYLPDETSSNLEEMHRSCADCGMIKITMHPPHGNAWREWQTRFGERWQGDATPPCDGKVGGFEADLNAAKNKLSGHVRLWSAAQQPVTA